MAGELREEDLIVLLSERAAREIYKKWLDTLHVNDAFDVHCISNKCMCLCLCVIVLLCLRVCYHMYVNTLCRESVFYAMLYFSCRLRR